MTHAVEKRVEALERLVNQLRHDQEQFSALKHLSEKTPNLLQIDSFVRNYNNRLKAMSGGLNNNKAVIRDVRDNSLGYFPKLKNQLELAVQRRDRTIKTIEGKLTAAETAAGGLAVCNDNTLDLIQAKIKDEILAGVANIEKQFESRKREYELQVQNKKSGIKSRATGLCKDAEDAKQKMLEYQKSNAARLLKVLPENASDPSSIEGLENLSKQLIKDCSDAILTDIGHRKGWFITKFREINLEYNREMLGFRAELEDSRNEIIPLAVKATTKPDVLFTSHLDTSKKMMDNLKNFSVATLDNLLEIINDFHEIIDEVASRTGNPDEVLAYKPLSDETREKTHLVDRRSRDELEKIDELIKKANALVKTVKSKKLPPKLKVLENDFAGLRKQISDKLYGVQALIDSFQTKCVGMARQMGSKQPTEESKQ